MRRGEAKYIIYANLGGIERQVTYLPLINECVIGGPLDLDISFHPNDTLCVFTLNKSSYANKENMINLIGKMSIVKQGVIVNLGDFSKRLSLINIDKLIIISINLLDFDEEHFLVQEFSSVKYVEIGIMKFLEFLTNSKLEFFSWNPYTLYVLRNGTYRDFKYILRHVGEFGINLGRGGGQKSHVLSPLDFRLTCYLMAMYNFDYKFISYLNMFNLLTKNQYLPFLSFNKKK